MVQRTRALQMLLGLLLLGSIYLLAEVLQLDLIRYLLAQLFQYGAIAALVVFQPELRSALARLGQNQMWRIFGRMEESQVVDEVVEAVERLSRSKIGAIIAMEQNVGLEEYAQTGSAVDARVSAEMLTTIFTPYSPLHDGAVLITGDQIRAAGAILPHSVLGPGPVDGDTSPCRPGSQRGDGRGGGRGLGGDGTGQRGPGRADGEGRRHGSPPGDPLRNATRRAGCQGEGPALLPRGVGRPAKTREFGACTRSRCV